MNIYQKLKRSGTCETVKSTEYDTK